MKCCCPQDELDTSTLHFVSLASTHLRLELGFVEPLLLDPGVLLQRIPLVLGSFVDRDTMACQLLADGAKLMKLKCDLVSMFLVITDG